MYLRETGSVASFRAKKGGKNQKRQEARQKRAKAKEEDGTFQAFRALRSEKKKEHTGEEKEEIWISPLRKKEREKEKPSPLVHGRPAILILTRNSQKKEKNAYQNPSTIIFEEER